MEHVEGLDCPCEPVTVTALGGGQVQVHREATSEGERKPQIVTCPHCATKIPQGVQDPYCPQCETWHLRGDHRVSVRALEEKVRALPAEGRRHVGSFIERAAVLGLLRKSA